MPPPGRGKGLFGRFSRLKRKDVNGAVHRAKSFVSFAHFQVTGEVLIVVIFYPQMTQMSADWYSGAPELTGILYNAR